MSFVKDFILSKRNNQTVFVFSDLSSAVEGYSGPKLKSALKYAVQKGDLNRISKGIYSLSREYSKQEFANKYRSPSYISLYTVLQKAGVVFQPYSSIYLISTRSEEVEIDSQKYIYRKIKDEILLNPMGVNNANNVQESTPERAICDKLYLDGDEYFDNLRDINWNLMSELNNQVYSSNKVIRDFINKNTK
jgi:predicted transcriptional regulator of viral defense system